MLPIDLISKILSFSFESSLEKSILIYSFGSASARLLTGTLPIYNELETLISFMFGTDKTLLFNSGYHANVGIASSLAGKKGLIVSDKSNHASIIDGMRLSNAKFLRYPHFDTESLENILKRERSNFEPVIIYTESVFSMDGDVAPLEKIVEIKEKYNCILVVDEAHAFGVCGKNALGVCEEKNIIACMCPSIRKCHFEVDKDVMELFYNKFR